MSFTPPGGAQAAPGSRPKPRRPSSPIDDLVGGDGRARQGSSGGTALGSIVTGQGGDLAGRPAPAGNAAILDKLDPTTRAMVEDAARRTGQDPAELAIAWGLVPEDEEVDFLGHLGPRQSGPWTPSKFGPGSLDTQPYVIGNEFDELSELSTEDLTRWQQKMVTLGFMDPDQVLFGVRDETSIKTMGGLLSLANAEGVPWGVMLQNLENMANEDGSLFDSDEDARKFTAPSYLAPDYATMAQKVKDTMRSTLGRDPDESELAVLVGELQGWDRQAFDAQVESSRGEFEAQAAGAPTSPDVQGVDPLARFNEFFEQKYENEIDFVEDRDEHTPLSQASVGGGVDTLSQMSRGGA